MRFDRRWRAVVLTGGSGFSQSGPLLAVFSAFTLLPQRLLPILANEFLHAQQSASLFVANSSIPSD
jgi:hypothetical protein